MATITLLLPDELVDEIDAYVGADHRLEFFTEAARRRLQGPRLANFFKEHPIVLKDEDHPEFAEGTAAYVRRLRSGEI